MGQKVQAGIALNVLGGAYVALNASTFARYVEIEEDELDAARQGLTIKWPDGTVTTYGPSQQPVKIGNRNGAVFGSSPLVGVPANYNGQGGAATLYCSATSATATTTKVRITEEN